MRCEARGPVVDEIDEHQQSRERGEAARGKIKEPVLIGKEKGRGSETCGERAEQPVADGDCE